MVGRHKFFVKGCLQQARPYGIVRDLTTREGLIHLSQVPAQVPAQVPDAAVAQG